jgi:AmmeMemoRadiSam system protein B
MMVSKKLGATKSMVLKYLNSGDTSGDKSGVVGYVSSIFYKPLDS